MLHAEQLTEERRKRYVGNNFDCIGDFDASGCTAHVASQSAVGLLPKWRAWHGSFDSDHPDSGGPDIAGKKATVRKINTTCASVHNAQKTIHNENNE
jgi:hypothetical protein